MSQIKNYLLSHGTKATQQLIKQAKEKASQNSKASKDSSELKDLFS
jgi:hypothetical protein